MYTASQSASTQSKAVGVYEWCTLVPMKPPKHWLTCGRAGAMASRSCVLAYAFRRDN